MTAFGDRVRAGLGDTLVRRSGPLLTPVIEGLVGPATTVDDLVAETDGGWAAIFDLDVTPAPATLGAATGTLIPAGLTLEQQRTYLREQPGRRRGSASSIIAAARAAAPGRLVDLFERLGSPWNLEVRLTGGSNDPITLAAVETAVRAQKPVGITLTVTLVAGASYDHLRLHHGTTYDAQAAAFGTYDDERTHLPEGGTTP
ncbi:hypothetical protein [Nocardioides sp.]|uniref:hypothetical protein n=1 Tax=Nocardioides sp. TaxID=35761 RepID=UPI002BBB99C8|nr:hypothetical protein [Nocardioides sp.]HXH77325.1 hypothetical protein [Nocardioides sp.]